MLMRIELGFFFALLKKLQNKTVTNIYTCSMLHLIFSHPPKRRRVAYASGIRPASASASASTLCTSYLKPLHGIISYCTCILV